MAIVKRLAEDPQWEVYLLNRGNRKAEVPEGVHQIIADIHDEDATSKALDGMEFDVVSDVDRRLYEKENVITSDAVILDRCKSWFNLVRRAVESEKGGYPYVAIMDGAGG